ncbi:hypothetical protein HAX54_013358, partial [Datura stramonium]|nr:hypothetical protein [Datura stramonium]
FVASFPYMKPGTKGKEKLIVLQIVNLLDFLALEGPEHLQLLLLVFKEMVVGWLCWVTNGMSCCSLRRCIRRRLVRLVSHGVLNEVVSLAIFCMKKRWKKND